MANIIINDIPMLNISDFDLFDDSDSFLTELSDNEELIIGGLKCHSTELGGRSCIDGNSIAMSDQGK
jgi:hypothetical protein